MRNVRGEQMVVRDGELRETRKRTVWSMAVMLNRGVESEPLIKVNKKRIGPVGSEGSSTWKMESLRMREGDHGET